MKEVRIQKVDKPEHRIKLLSICQAAEDKQCDTSVHKSFFYKVFKCYDTEPQLNPPQIYVFKALDTKNKTEKFRFQVKGCFYVTHKRFLYKIRYRHLLDIEIKWKKIFSPKKSAVVT